MPLLDRHGLKLDEYVRAASTDEAAGASHILAPWDAWATIAPNGDRTFGVEIPNTVRAAELQAFLAEVKLIAIAFPGFTDGRGFSLARQLRSEGYSGAIRAVGPLIPDQLAQLFACGVDEVEISSAHLARQPIGQWRAASDAISLGYQRGCAQGANIIEQRRSARQHAKAQS